MLSLLLSLLLAFAPLQAQAPAAPVAAPMLQEDPAVTALARKIYGQMRAGKVDASLLTDAMNKELGPEALAQNKPIFDQLGAPVKLTLESAQKTAAGTRWVYLAVFATAQLHVNVFIMTDGKVGGYALAL